MEQDAAAGVALCCVWDWKRHSKGAHLLSVFRAVLPLQQPVERVTAQGHPATAAAGRQISHTRLQQDATLLLYVQIHVAQL